MIASRKEENLQKAVQEFYIPPNSPAEAAYIKCNIRVETEVGFYLLRSLYEPNISINNAVHHNIVRYEVCCLIYCIDF